jgi:hypothetical protein
VSTTHGTTVIVIDAIDRPRTLAVLTSIVSARGHHLSWVRSEPTGQDRLTVTLAVPTSWDGASRLALQLERRPEVVDARALEPVSPAAATVGIRRFEVRTRGGAAGRNCEAIVGLRAEDGGALGAGESTDPLEALARAALTAHTGGDATFREVIVVDDPCGATAVVEFDGPAGPRRGVARRADPELAVLAAVRCAVGVAVSSELDEAVRAVG